MSKTIEETVRDKELLSRKIELLLQTFAKETGVKIDGIELLNYYAFGLEKPEFYRVVIKVSL